MSCAWRFECLSHNPSIFGEEFTNHTNNYLYKKALELARQRPLDENANDVSCNDNYSHYERAARYFLIEHRDCDIGMIDEYGRRMTLEEATPTDEKSDTPDWYRVTSRGITIIQCIHCIRMGGKVFPACTIRGGEAVCHHHIEIKERTY